jgi:uroporphyrinogen-III synthase
MPERRPRRRWRVVITRPEGRGEGLAARLRRLGAQVDLRPTIAFEAPSDPGPRDRALAELDRYRFVVVTSPTAVEYLLDALRTAGLPMIDGARVAAVGPGTATAFAAAGVRAGTVAARADGEGLAETLAPQIAAGDRVLLVRPESGARDLLPRALEACGAELDAVALYRTVAGPECAPLAADLVAGQYDVAVFSSPSTFLRLLDGAGSGRTELLDALRTLRTIAIGPVTARAMAAHGVGPDAVATSPTEDAVATAVESVW